MALWAFLNSTLNLLPFFDRMHSWSSCLYLILASSFIGLVRLGSQIQLIELTDNYKKIEQTTDTTQKYCVSLEKNNIYECNVCDSSKSSVVKNLDKCPENLPYNLDININNHLTFRHTIFIPIFWFYPFSIMQ